MATLLNRCTYCMSETCDRTKLIECVECEQSKPLCRFEDLDDEICTVCQGLLWESLDQAIKGDNVRQRLQSALGERA